MQKTYPSRNLLQGMALLAILGGVGSLALQHSREGASPCPRSCTSWRDYSFLW